MSTRILRKRFLLGALAAVGLSGQAGFADETIKVMPKSNGAPMVLPYQPSHSYVDSGSRVIVNDCGYDDGCGRRGSLIGGVEALILRPHFDRNPGLIFDSQRITFGPADPNGPNGFDGTNDTFLSTSATREFDYDWSVSPRIWIGFQSECGLGVRGRWFRFDQSSDPLFGAGSETFEEGNFAERMVVSSVLGGGIPVNGGGPAPAQQIMVLDGGGVSTATSSQINIVGDGIQIIPLNDPITASSSLYLDIYDVEVTAAGSLGCWQLQGAAGARYAYIEQTYNVFLPGTPQDNLAVLDTGEFLGGSRRLNSASVLSRQTFTGVGPTVALESSRRIGESNLAVTGSARGSVLFGKGRQNTIVSNTFASAEAIGGTVEAPIFGPAEVDQFTSITKESGWDVLGILELEVGVEWSRDMGNMGLVLRPAFVGQIYVDGGSATSRTGPFGLVGASISAGVRY